MTTVTNQHFEHMHGSNAPWVHEAYQHGKRREMIERKAAMSPAILATLIPLGKKHRLHSQADATATKPAIPQNPLKVAPAIQKACPRKYKSATMQKLYKQFIKQKTQDSTLEQS